MSIIKKRRLTLVILVTPQTFFCRLNLPINIRNILKNMESDQNEFPMNGGDGKYSYYRNSSPQVCIYSYG